MPSPMTFENPAQDAPLGDTQSRTAAKQSKSNVPHDNPTRLWYFLGRNIAKLAAAAKARKHKLLDAVSKGHVNEVEELLSAGGDVQARTALGQSLLYLAASQGCCAVAQVLLHYGADVDDMTLDGYSALYIASSLGKERMVTVLLQNGASVTQHAANGLLPLHIAAKQGHADVMRQFLQHKPVREEERKRWNCDVEASRSHRTALMLACQEGRSEVVEMLLDRGADPYAEDRDGNSPMHFACAQGDVQSVYLLITAGGDPDMPNVAEETAVDVARHHRHNQVLYMLECASSGNLRAVERFMESGECEEEPEIVPRDNDTFLETDTDLSTVLVRRYMRYSRYLAFGAIVEETEDDIAQEQ